MMGTPTLAEIDSALSGVPMTAEEASVLKAILDRLSPPEQEQPDEATVWANKALCAAGYYYTLTHTKVEAAATALSELIASKDAEADAKVKYAMNRLNEAHANKPDWEKLWADEKSKCEYWEETNAQQIFELAALRAEIERLKADAATTEAQALRLAWETARGTNADMHKTPLSAYQTIVWALKKLYDGASSKAAERNTAEPPGHTDLMVSPESIDAFLEANPPVQTAPVVVTQADRASALRARRYADNYTEVCRTFAYHRTEAEARGRREALEKMDWLRIASEAREGATP